MWVQVDKRLKISAEEKIFGNPRCVSGHGGNSKIITTVHNYLLPSKSSNGMIKSELNNGCAKSGVVNVSTPPYVDKLSSFEKKCIILLFFVKCSLNRW